MWLSFFRWVIREVPLISDPSTWRKLRWDFFKFGTRTQRWTNYILMSKGQSSRYSKRLLVHRFSWGDTFFILSETKLNQRENATSLEAHQVTGTKAHILKCVKMLLMCLCDFTLSVDVYAKSHCVFEWILGSCGSSLYVPAQCHSQDGWQLNWIKGLTAAQYSQRTEFTIRTGFTHTPRLCVWISISNPLCSVCLCAHVLSSATGNSL